MFKNFPGREKYPIPTLHHHSKKLAEVANPKPMALPLHIHRPLQLGFPDRQGEKTGTQDPALAFTRILLFYRSQQSVCQNGDPAATEIVAKFQK